LKLNSQKKKTFLIAYNLKPINVSRRSNIFFISVTNIRSLQFPRHSV